MIFDHYVFYKLGQFLVLNLPLKLSYSLAILLADLQYTFSFKDRACVKNNLFFVLGKKEKINSLTRGVFRNFAKYLVDFFRLSIWNKASIKKFVKIEGTKYLDRALSYGKGVIALTCHLGNWELGGVVTAIQGYPIAAIALPHKNRKVDNFFNRQRRCQGLKVIPMGIPLRNCFKELKENHMVAFLGDRDFSQKGLTMEFLGKRTRVPKGPAYLSFKLGCPIVPGFMLRQSNNTFRLIFERPIEPKLNLEEKAALEEITQRYLKVLEDYIRNYPNQWFMFQRFWKPPIL